MTQKQECLCYCIAHLESTAVGYIFCSNTFNAFFEKHYNPIANIYWIGVNAADEMIQSFKPQQNEPTND